MAKMIPVLCVVAPGSGYGKTPLIQELVSGLLKQGITSCVLKHFGHRSDPDLGKDTWLYRKSGALGAAVVNEEGLASFFIPRRTMEESIALLQSLNPDLIICEGFKGSNYPKIVVLREAEEFSILPSLSNVLAVVFNGKPPQRAGLPPIIRNDGSSLTAFVLSFFKAAVGGET